MLKLSIIIPCYNAEPYIHELLDALSCQITKEVEVIIIDDGSSKPFKTDYSWAKVFRKKNGGCSTARNLGLDKAKGQYISYIDADDMVPIHFVDKVLDKIKGGYDVIDLSWKSFSAEGAQHNHKLSGDADWLTNPSVCTRIFKRSFIGETRFNEKKDSTEDEDFSRKLGYIYKDPAIKHGAITDYLYFYRTAVSNSKIKRFKKGLMNTKRIVYYVPQVAADDQDLLQEIKNEDKVNEVWLLTNKCDIPEMRRFCQIHKPFPIWGHELRGQAYSGFTKINPPLKAQIVLYCEYANKIGGITTFIAEFCKNMSKFYDILFVYQKMDMLQLSRIMQIVPTVKYSPTLEIVCDTLILNRLTDKIFPNITYKQSIQVLHCCRQNKFMIPEGRDLIVNVSQAAKDSWGEDCKDGIVIHNMIDREARDMLFLVSATRVATGDKGSNDQRMLKLAKMLEDAKIPYLWLNFSDNPLPGAPQSFINMKPTLNVQDYIKKADYLVQLSDEEAYSYAILEALVNNTAVLATPFPSLFEQGFKDGETGYIVPFDMKFDVKKLQKVPIFTFLSSNEPIIESWQEILGNPQPREPKKTEDVVLVKVLKYYRDIEFDEYLDKGTEVVMRQPRALYLSLKGLVHIIGSPENVQKK